MKIKGHKYVFHKIMHRPWGPECRVTVIDANGIEITRTIPLPSVDMNPGELGKKIGDLLEMESTRRSIREQRKAEKVKNGVM